MTFTQEKANAILLGYIQRYKNKVLKDKVSQELIFTWISRYIRNYKETQEDNKLLIYKKKRHENFPSEISENLVKFAFYKKYGIMPSWDTSCGDLSYKVYNRTLKIECKAFSSVGPSSFGPTESWDKLCFVDARNFINGKYIIYIINLRSDSPIWLNVKFSKNETYGNMVSRKIRPRTSFDKIKPQIFKYCSILFNGEIETLLY